MRYGTPCIQPRRTLYPPAARRTRSATAGGAPTPGAPALDRRSEYQRSWSAPSWQPPGSALANAFADTVGLTHWVASQDSGVQESSAIPAMQIPIVSLASQKTACRKGTLVAAPAVWRPVRGLGSRGNVIEAILDSVLVKGSVANHLCLGQQSNVEQLQAGGVAVAAGRREGLENLPCLRRSVDSPRWSSPGVLPSSLAESLCIRLPCYSRCQPSVALIVPQMNCSVNRPVHNPTTGIASSVAARPAFWAEAPSCPPRVLAVAIFNWVIGDCFPPSPSHLPTPNPPLPSTISPIAPAGIVQ